MSSKRLRADSNVSEHNIPVSMVAPPVYQQLLPRSPKGITFLFNSRFSNTLQEAASQVSDEEAASRGMRLRAMEGLYGAFFSSNPLGSSTGGFQVQ